jgi:hypothetical protein
MSVNEDAADSANLDRVIAPYLREREQILVRRSNARLTPVGPGQRPSPPVSGPLFLTDWRLMNIDDKLHSIELADITELALSGDQVLVTLRGSHGAILELDSPDEFRSSVADAISASRAR